MNSSRLPLIIGLVVAAVFGWFLYSYWQNSQFVKSLPTYASAVKRYSHDQTWRGRTLPATVTAQDLVEGGYLSGADAHDVADKNITFYPTTDETNPAAILVRVKMPDGSQVVALADGSVQTLAKSAPVGSQP